MHDATLQAAFVLHHRPFRDTSVIADLVTPDHGRVSVIARGARSAKSRRRVLLQPFRPLLASWTGRSELRTLTTLEESGQAIALSGEALACAYYATELALRLLPKDESNVEAFALYASTLGVLSGSDSQACEIQLRLYEIDLLDSLGLLPRFAECDQEQGQVDANAVYRYHPSSGQATRSANALDTVAVTGITLIALDQRSFDTSDEVTQSLVLPEAKRLMRQILRIHLGAQPLKSREVFRQLRPKPKPFPGPGGSRGSKA